MKQQNKQRRAERLCNLLDISPETLPFGHAIEILGRSLVKIRGGGKILLYTEDEIRISLGSHKEYIAIVGSSLSCSSYNRGTLGIEGNINSLSFLREQKEKK